MTRAETITISSEREALANVLHGRHAVVTGGSRGIGASIAETLARCGARVTSIGRHTAALHGEAKRIEHFSRGNHDMNKDATSAAVTLDTETRVTNDTHQAVRLWLRLLACTNLIEAQVRSRLRISFDITLPRFDLMAQLERYPEGLKMGELSKRMMVTGGNVTGITDQLVAEGLVVREDNPKDRRAYIVKLTKEGRRVFKQIAEPHHEWIVELFDGLSEREKQQLYGLLGQLKERAAAVAAGPKT